MSDKHGGGGDDHNVTLDAGDDDWEWRRKIRAHQHTHLIYRIVVGVVGLVIVVFGLILVPFPGPGWLGPQPWWVKGLVLLVTAVAVAVVFWLLFLISGVPAYFPDSIEEWLKSVPGLAR